MADAERWAAGIAGSGVRDRRRDRHQSGRRHRRSRLRGALEAVHPLTPRRFSLLQGSVGRRRVKLAPVGVGSQVRSPWCCWAMRRAMARPRPWPGLLGSSRTKRSKIRSRWCSGTPGPSSATQRLDVSVAPLKLHLYSAGGLDGSEGVVDEVAEDAFERIGVAAHGGVVVGAEHDRARGCACVCVFDEWARDRGEVDGRGLDVLRGGRVRGGRRRGGRVVRCRGRRLLRGGRARAVRVARAGGFRRLPGGRRSGCGARGRRRRGSGGLRRRWRVLPRWLSRGRRPSGRRLAARLPSSVSVRLGSRRSFESPWAMRVAVSMTAESGRRAVRVPRRTRRLASASAAAATSSSTRSSW